MNPSVRSLARLLVLSAALVAVGLTWRTAHEQRYATGEIIGGSMAPALAGTPHFDVVCADCGFPFRCDAETLPYREEAVCPNCGYAVNDVALLTAQPGDPVQIDREAFAVRPLQRWDVVALESPDDDAQLNVKRIVGLPGEHVSIRQGDLYIDGRIHRKSLGDLKQLAVVVHDDKYRPTKTAGLPARWQGEHNRTHWRMTEKGYACHAQERSGEVDWLMYSHWACMASPLARTRETPILDNDIYNQGASRELHEIQDLMLRCRVEARDAGALYLRLHNGREWLEAEIRPIRQWAILRNSDGLELARAPIASEVLHRGAKIELAHCDGRVLLAIENATVLEYPIKASTERLQPEGRPLRIGVFEMQVQVSELCVLRDLHYLDPLDTGRPWSAEYRLAADEIFVLGDNGPVSRDSRFWKPGSVTSRSLLGRVWPPGPLTPALPRQSALHRLRAGSVGAITDSFRTSALNPIHQ